MDGYGIYIKILLLVFGTIILFYLVCDGIPNMYKYWTGYKSDEEIAVENDYTAYFDGQEIDLEKLDLSQYDTSVNHETQTIYITYKRKNSSSLYPVFIPYSH